ncbi:MAG: TAXI family TRAP transporter solute-binding subunit [Hyphomicrobiaceae bacterium]
MQHHWPKRHAYAFTIAIAAFAGAGLAQAADTKLPNPLSWTAYGVGSSGYNQSVAIGKALKDSLGVDLRVLPGKNDVSRTLPLKAGKVEFSATGVGASFMAQEGVFDFARKSWGPQELRILMLASSDANLSVGVAADLGIKEIKDLKGKRVAWVVGSPSLNQNVEAILAFGGLTWADVKKVEFPGFGQSWDGIKNNQVDAAFAQTASGKAYEVANSPRGLYWPPLPHDDKAAWARLKAIAPFFQPNVGTVGANMSKEKPHIGPSYPYPVLMTYASQKDDIVHAMTKAMVELFPKYKDASPGINGWALEKQDFAWLVPYHPGAVAYFKSIGKWTPAAEANNQKLIKRQQVLKAAWADVNKKNIADEQAFIAEWMKIRSEKLKAAGFEPIFK